ncbi:MAG: carbohydrate binding family 9 domain-containing protein [Deltaproteobacteria bacterium]|nr:carbohydrate binding family 9 domain-containing protein [Deltaproteobacteria bacterium]
MLRPVIILFLCSVLIFGSAAEAHQRISVTAVSDAPVIDGVLEDSTWRKAAFFDQFTQQSPQPFAAPGERTEVAVAYDSQNVYVAVRCHTSRRGSTISRLVRRDRDGDFDKISIIFSPLNDGKTGYGFTVNPDGMVQDGAWSNDATYDSNWDALWQVATHRMENEWTAEFAIPHDQMRFAEPLTEMGFQVKRWIASRHELDVFNPKAAGELGEISRAGKLDGFGHLEPRLPFSVRPEVFVSHIRKDDGAEGTSPEGTDIGAGGYIKAGVAPGWTIDLAITPDFGEVELDNARINLTNIETLYGEKRPFFLENRQMFETPIQLFYSRRLGNRPPQPEIADTESIVEVPLNTPILLATKFSGTNASGMNLGVMHVLSSPVRGWIQNNDNGERFHKEISVFTHDNVLRIAKQFQNGSDVGVLATAHLPENHQHQAFAGGGDWNMLWRNREYAFKGQVVGSSVQRDESESSAPGYDTGMGVYTRLGRLGGDLFRADVQYEYRSDDFDINALGYMDRNDIHRVTGSFNILLTEKQRLIYELYSGGQLYLNWNTDGLNLSRALMTYLNIKWRNRMWTHMGSNASLSCYDDMEFANGPALKRIPGVLGWITVISPLEKPFGGSLDYNMGTDDTGYYFILTPAVQLRTGRVEFELNYSFVKVKDRESYADTLDAQPISVTDSSASEHRFVLAKRNLLESDIGLKSTIVLAPGLTAEVNTQLLATVAHYHDFRELMPNSSVAPFDTYNGNPDFSTIIWNLQSLIRYEFRPQSTLFLMYSRQSNGAREIAPNSLRLTYTSVDQYPEQRFMVKVSYLF